MTNTSTDAGDWCSDRQAIAADHPSLPGHFPGRPVVPGVVILDCVREALQSRYPQHRLAGLPAVKFLAPLLPEQGFIIQLSGEAPRLRFVVQRDSGETLAQGQLAIEAQAQA
ncbi:MAG: hypothetical protein ACPHER_06555 [Nevskiales bacterium]